MIPVHRGDRADTHTFLARNSRWTPVGKGGTAGQRGGRRVGKGGTAGKRRRASWPPRHDSASDITLPRATSLLGTAPPALRDPFANEITLNQRADEITVNRPAADVTVNRRAEEKGGRWHIELELDAEQIARLHRLGLAH